MSNNDDKDRWETFCKLYDKLSSKEEMRELFEEEIKCFSLYLSHVNQDYVYNATFLPQFNDDFWNFLCAFNKKYKIVEFYFTSFEADTLILSGELLYDIKYLVKKQKRSCFIYPINSLPDGVLFCDENTKRIELIEKKVV